MGQPPDRAGLGGIQPQIRFDNNKKLTLCSPGGKFLVMSRKPISNLEDSVSNLNNVSPFLIKKVIDSTCGGEVELCKKLRNGTVLIKTKTLAQAEKLIKLCSLSSSIDVEMSEHNGLNFCKGVIYCNDLRGISNEVILEEIKHQNVVKVDKILKRENEILKETGLIIITFSSLSLPSELSIGYEKVKLRPFIPLPMRCNNCFAYGHIAKHCKNDMLCGNCSNKFHLNLEEEEKCTNPKSCCNCIKDFSVQHHHSAFDKTCPTFLKEKEIQAIITLEKMNRRSAIATFNSRHPNNSFAKVIQNNNSTTTSLSAKVSGSLSGTSLLTSERVKSPNPSTTTRTTVDYSDFDRFLESANLSVPNKVTLRSKSILLPLKTSSRTRQQMKKISRKNKKDSPNVLLDSENSDDNVMKTDEPH